ncbi:hypothetical protein KXD93_29165 [Mucilaginibacter sp. BJC16-A38]|uniref:hypothetical protein n=1 Tax=Mucilaginibacter phenanthrenivorans TaxID=1234842 RepID=UPI00215852F8|nr:hypothetical protein [Mucilaginibacter phenanthrenivorans]MCR8561762.1 hypothetical protein [Mucilaginibacter phenanthrenivorans]
MRKIYYKIFASLIIIASISGCKLDPPIYPAGSTSTGTSGKLVDNGSTITYTISGTTTTLKLAFFQVIAADPTTSPNGNTQILGGTTQSGGFSLSFSNNKAGTYNIDLLYINGLLGDSGKVTVTELNVTSADGMHGTIKGTFTTDLIDLNTNATTTGITGSFNITI